MGSLRRLLGLMLCLVSIRSYAEQRAVLVRDLPGAIPQDSLTTSSDFWVTVGTTTWFVATDGKHRNVWKTDGTSAGTLRVTDHWAQYALAQNALTFVGLIEDRLVYSDGGGSLYALNANGGAPVLLGCRFPLVGRGVNFGGALYFVVSYPSFDGGWLWVTDGTKEGTKEIPHINGVHPAIVAGPKGVLFRGKTTLGWGIYSTDGTEAGTRILRTTEHNFSYNSFYFSYQAVTVGSKVFIRSRLDGLFLVTDGTVSGTMRLYNTFPFWLLGAIGDTLYFLGGSTELWQSDGTSAGTKPTLSSLRPLWWEAVGVSGGKMFFFAEQGLSAPALCVSDGTTTTRLMKMNDPTSFSWRPYFYAGTDRFYFSYDDGVHGLEPWVTDGTIGGTHLLIDLEPGSRSGWSGIAFQRPDGLLVGARASEGGLEPWLIREASSGEVTATQLANIGADRVPQGSSPRLMRADGDRIYFTASRADRVAVGWSDGTRGGTVTTSVDLSVEPTDAALVGGRYCIAAPRSEPTKAGEVATLDGTTGVATRINARPLSHLHASENRVAFVSENAAGSEDLILTDGTTGGTISTPRPAMSTSGYRLFAIGDTLWITNRGQIWYRTSEGTIELPRLASRTGEITDIQQAAEHVWFLEEWNGIDGNGAKVWRSDSSKDRMHVAMWLDPNVLMLQPHSLFVTPREAFVVHANTVYRTDGTEAGTTALPQTLRFDDCGVTFVPFGDAVVFAARLASGDYSVWKWNGTAAGTVEIHHASAAIDPCKSHPAVFGSSIFFAGADPEHGIEPWVSDGTAAGTHLFADLVIGTESSNPQELTTAGSRVFFSATTPNLGRELWAIANDPALSSRKHAIRH